MKKILLFLTFTCFVYSSNAQNYLFNNALWGQSIIKPLEYVPSDNPAEVYWQDSTISFCIQNDTTSVSKSFSLMEVIEDMPPSLDQFNQKWGTAEGFAVQLEGYYRGKQTILLTVKFFNGEIQIGEFNYPIIQ